MHLADVRHAHFIAIGGAGMSGVAWVMLNRGITVSGSDLVGNSMTRRLAEHGARCFVGHRPEQINGADLVVVSTAISRDNCELREAARRGVPVWHRSEALAALMSQGRSIAVTGSHGKTTTTAMIGVVLEQAGCDPTVVVGGDSLDFGGTARAGRADLTVAEVDESDRSFLRFSPEYALITNIEADHLDHYADYDDLLEAFRRFVQRVERPPIVCSDDDGVRQVMAASRRSFVTYSVADSGADYFARDIKLELDRARFEFVHAGRKLGEAVLPTPGMHNVSNALGALALAHRVGLAPEAILPALAQFRGVERRLSIRGEPGGVLIVDDYAHHPSEVEATLTVGKRWAASRAGRLVCVFQPHRYTRTEALGRRFGPALAGADVLVVTDVYAAGEKPIDGITGAIVAESVPDGRNTEVEYIAELGHVAGALVGRLRPGDVLMTLGAGNVWRVGEDLAALLAKKAGSRTCDETTIPSASAEDR